MSSIEMESVTMRSFKIRSFKMAVIPILLSLVMSFTTGVVNLYAQSQEVSDDETGFRKKSLLREDDITPATGENTNVPPGKSRKIERSYENSPPLIPHDVSSVGPITSSENGCYNCHDPKVAKSVRAVPVPKSHLMDLSSGKGFKGTLNGNNYNCTQCHVSQKKVKPPINNKFKAEYRSAKSRHSSNLTDVLDEGVEVDK